MEKPSQKPQAADFAKLRESVTGLKRDLLKEIANSYLETGTGILANDLYREFKKPRVIETLKELGGGIVYEMEDHQSVSNRFEPSFLGLLVSPQGVEYERLLVRFLRFAEKLYQDGKEGEEVRNVQVEGLLKLNREEAFRFFRLVQKAGLCGNSGYSNEQRTWGMRWFREVADLPSWKSKSAFLHARATQFYDATAPVFVADRYGYAPSLKVAANLHDLIESTAIIRDLVFVSYSHKDSNFLDELITHLKPLVRENKIASWSDKQIAPGDHWYSEIKAALSRTKVAVLLVSPDFLASDFIHKEELGPLLQEAERGGVRIVWVPVRSCSYKETPLKNYQAVASPEKPLAMQKKFARDASWVAVCEAIKKATGA